MLDLEQLQKFVEGILTAQHQTLNNALNCVNVEFNRVLRENERLRKEAEGSNA